MTHRPPEDLLCDLHRNHDFMALDEKVSPFTMTSPEAKWALYQAVKYVLLNRIPGDFVECGVWKGGSSMLAALAFLHFGATRRLWLYDTFEGMTEPTAEDGSSAFRWTSDYMKVDLETVRKNVISTGYPPSMVYLVKGDVAETLSMLRPESISILRLDTDFYASTKAELEHLYPLLSPGGILIVDDYEAWPGSKQAVNEYLPPGTWLNRVDYSVRLVVKPA